MLLEKQFDPFKRGAIVVVEISCMLATTRVWGNVGKVRENNA